MPKVNKTKYAILGVLTLMPGSGYDIKKFCDRGISLFWNENFGHIYPVLKQMELEGLITKKSEQNEGKPDRNVFYITQQGRDELTGWLAQPVEQAPARLELLLKLYFAKNVPAQNILQELERLQKMYEKGLEECLKTEAGLLSNEKLRADDGYPYWLATLRYGILDARFRIQWCQETIESLKTHKAARASNPLQNNFTKGE